jgi:hypothetical protein
MNGNIPGQGSTIQPIKGRKRRYVAFLLKRAPILLASAIPCFFLTLILLIRTSLTLHHSWLLALFVSAGVGGAILGLVERFISKRAFQRPST